MRMKEFGMAMLAMSALPLLEQNESIEFTRNKTKTTIIQGRTFTRKPCTSNQRKSRKLARQNPHSKFAK